MSRLFRVILLLTIAVAASGQQPVKVDVRLVNTIVTVTDSAGRYVVGLGKDDFTIEDDGTPQPICHFSFDNQTPVSVGIVFDTSGSMQSKMRTAVSAVNRFVRTVHVDDDIFLMTFAGDVELRQDFTDNRDQLAKAMTNMRANGGTKLYDALGQGMGKIKDGRQKKRAILLITDGQDTDSQTKYAEVLKSIRESELLLYPLGIKPLTASQRDGVDLDVLQSFATESGGRAFLIADSVVGNAGQIDKVLNQIADELRSQYTIGFYPAHPDDGKFHRLTVRTRTGLFARTRPGYTAR